MECFSRCMSTVTPPDQEWEHGFIGIMEFYYHTSKQAFRKIYLPKPPANLNTFSHVLTVNKNASANPQVSLFFPDVYNIPQICMILISSHISAANTGKPLVVWDPWSW